VNWVDVDGERKRVPWNVPHEGRGGSGGGRGDGRETNLDPSPFVNDGNRKEVEAEWLNQAWNSLENQWRWFKQAMKCLFTGDCPEEKTSDRGTCYDEFPSQ
jgi:hypothetical protein